jgi:hypothetical protein
VDISKYLDPEVENCFYNFLDRLRPIVSKIYNIKLHNTERYFETWKKIRLAEASEIHMYGLNVQMHNYSKEVRKLLIEGKKVLVYDYLNSKKNNRRNKGGIFSKTVFGMFQYNHSSYYDSYCSIIL